MSTDQSRLRKAVIEVDAIGAVADITIVGQFDPETRQFIASGYRVRRVYVGRVPLKEQLQAITSDGDEIDVLVTDGGEFLHSTDYALIQGLDSANHRIDLIVEPG